jgi:hypothetical protein
VFETVSNIKEENLSLPVICLEHVSEEDYENMEDFQENHDDEDEDEDDEEDDEEEEEHTLQCIEEEPEECV